MSDKELFSLAGIKEAPPQGETIIKRSHPPLFALIIFALIVLGCIFIPMISKADPAYLDLANCSKAPCREFPFGTDSLGRDIFSCIWYGGRVSIFIGFLSTVISTLIALIYGSISGVASKGVSAGMMRLAEILLSVPSLLIIVFVQAILGKASVLSISLVIGITSWCSIAKVVDTQVRQIKSSEYVIAAKCMGGGFFHILRRHLAPNFISSIMFMVVMNISAAIMAESTLSFMGIGLPLEIISWGSMLSLAQTAVMSRQWWIILIPGAFLIALLMCITDIGNYLRKSANKKGSNL